MSIGEKTKMRIIEAGLAIWHKEPLKVNARQIAKRLGITHGTVLYHFKNSDNLRQTLAFHAVQRGDSRLIIHLLASNDPSVSHLTQADYATHLKNL